MVSSTLRQELLDLLSHPSIVGPDGVPPGASECDIQAETGLPANGAFDPMQPALASASSHRHTRPSSLRSPGQHYPKQTERRE